MLRKTLRQILLLSMTLAPNIVGFADAAFAQKPTAQQALPALIEKTLAWLPIDTESIVVARSFKIPNDTDKGVAEKEPAEAVATALRLLVMGPISYTKNGKYTDPLAGKKVALALGAARRFHGGTLFGRDRYQGCHVLIFEDELGAAGDRMTELLRKDAIAIHTVEGYETYVFSSIFVKNSVFKDEGWEGMFIVRPQPNVVLCATQKTFLKEVLRRRKMKPADRALPQRLPIWKHVDRTASAWMVRHITKRGAPDCAVTLQPHKRNELEIVYLPANKNFRKWTLKVAKSRWQPPHFEVPSRIRQFANGATVVTVPLDTEKKVPPFDLSGTLAILLFISWGDGFKIGH